jgi:RNA polymerase subunit RPABC4/transcription elongation factor Spt4
LTEPADSAQKQNIENQGGAKMALKPCRECGEKVSTFAGACPKCGKKHPTIGPTDYIIPHSPDEAGILSALATIMV